MDGSETSDDWFDPETTTFGDRLAGAREAAGLSQTELARRLGVKPSTMKRWEEDRAEPRANRVQMLSGLLNVSLVWLMTGEGQGVDLDAAADAGDGDLLREVERARREAARMADRLRLLEGRLRARLDA
ncbi:helix-turn-helix domain-containing protein [Jannaschia aquimarina]|uniref:RodZ_1 protein n=1 Tax=Jannaschia aquimarina TaxID=935700 RepID=A0A0D1ER16_9RHOB|nr:helix-turn-helix transcriptional regulator [Jannaschia aquimarina]KIT18080.1 Cytoskeleton protein RodZ [Jannaschia aquimarina]SNS89964.1 transcriptional regulator, XRE family [Jannaschia aquimarina]